MTYFSSMLLNPALRTGRKLLGNPQAMHAAVMASFPPDAFGENDGRPLWRMDHDGETHRLYIVSSMEPDLRHIQEQAGWLNSSEPWKTVSYDRFLDNLMVGQEWTFRLTANPVKRIAPGKDSGRKRGKVLPHVTVEQQIAWLEGRASNAGFEVLDGANSAGVPFRQIAVTRREDSGFNRFSDLSNADPRPNRERHRDRVTIRRVQFEGNLRIIDVGAFRQTLTEGLGRAKAYGCGLMTLRPVNG